MPSITSLALCMTIVLATATDVHATSVGANTRNLRVQTQSDDAVQTTSKHLNLVPGLIDANVDVKTTPGAAATVTTTGTTGKTTNSATIAHGPGLPVVHNLPAVAPIAGIASPLIAPVAPAVAGVTGVVQPALSGLNFDSLLGGDKTHLLPALPVVQPVVDVAKGVVTPVVETAKGVLAPVAQTASSVVAPVAETAKGILPELSHY